MAVKSSAGHTQYKLSLHLITRAYAPETIDTLRKIRSHVWMTEIFLSVEMIFTFRITNIPDTNACSDCLQFTIIIDLTGETIKRMIREHQLDNIFS